MTGTKNDRLQTSTCSVAVLPEPRNITVKLQDRDLKWEYMRAGGAGGQVSEGKTNIFLRVLRNLLDAYLIFIHFLLEFL